ncbi:cytochrome c biogenesis protein CcsA [Desulfurivibrio dismutans]|uniref:cytochrome c biogenesis protein CcsA n=1 Tax=Desulfurivibrio dismutans TaxID=1398908 RepID=UPI0023D9A144|nr:cytochrome c biogenesis protein CcsA [Desulfurivibrio alkaliphilus]MDF1614169.1 cytochrome c biogenesis protein CcsA [Desulfurivibrio alkaliphilus]
MENLAVAVETYSRGGAVLMPLLLLCALLLAVTGLGNLFGRRPLLPRWSFWLLLATAGLMLLGFLGMIWFHWQIAQHAVLELPEQLAAMLNQQLAAMNRGAAYGIPLYDPQSPPRYLIPPWIEYQRYYFWFFCFALMAVLAHRRLENHRFRGSLYLLLAAQLVVLYFLADPFREPLPRFFAEITPWFTAPSAWEQLGMFMRLYPRLEFYYTASYMWFHPPLLFISYACITIFFAVSLLMLIRRELEVEKVGYDYAKFGYFLLTLGMLLGYPWALKAWGPNWWWDPKVSSSIMLWAIFSTYLHTRLYANKKGMWYFSAALGLLCFVAMIFTFVASYIFPGEHSLM